MDFELTVLQLLPVVTGQSARGEWKKQEVIFEQPGEYSRKLCVGFWNDRAVDAANLQPGDRVALSVNVESREYNGRWYTEVRAWRMNRLDGQSGAPGAGYQQGGQAMGAPTSTAAAPTAVPATTSASTAAPEGPTSAADVDDLPF